MAEEVHEPVSPPANGGAPDWRKDTNQREYIPRQGRRGVLYRQGNETVEQARERDAQPRDQRTPKRKRPATPKKQPPPREPDLKALELVLTEALRSPAALCAAFGDEWAAEHFTSRGPYLARNLVLASQHNPWLRGKLEELSTGGDAAMKFVSLLGVGGAFVMYAVPPAVYFFNLPINPKARVLLDIPERKHAPAPPQTAAQAAASPGLA